MDDTPGTWRLAVKQAASLGGIGLLAGALAGWVALLGAEGVDARGATAADVYWVLFPLLPAALLLWWWLGRQGAAVGAPSSRVVTLALLAGLVGAILATLAYVAVATQVLALFGGTDPGQFQGALYEEIGGPVAWGLVALVTATALVLALWAYGRGHKRAG